jgi:hypothetical protein
MKLLQVRYFTSVEGLSGSVCVAVCLGGFCNLEEDLLTGKGDTPGLMKLLQVRILLLLLLLTLLLSCWV